MGKSFDPIGVAGEMRDAKLCNSTPRPIVSMSFQLAIPWRVALQQGPPPLHQPGTIMHERAAAGHQKPANGQPKLFACTPGGKPSRPPGKDLQNYPDCSAEAPSTIEIVSLDSISQETYEYASLRATAAR